MKKYVKNSKKSKTELLKKYIIITVAAFIYAAGVSLFIDPNNMAPGGVTGISIILSRLLPVSTGTWILLLNIPILLYGVWKFGWGLTVSSIYATTLISVFTNLLAVYEAATRDTLLAALAGGALSAAAIGVIFRAGATTGGMDIIVKAIRLKVPHIKTGRLFFLTDAVIVTMSGILFRDINAALYAAISAICASIVMDFVLYGRDEAKLLYIISSKPEQITERILAELDIGVTYIDGQGAYSGKDKKVIMCAMKKTISPLVEEIVKEQDPAAFMIITSATEIFGEGYKSYFSERM
ncbi:MAG: YitT family protein [Clostridiales bacterium]|nr:YitT family protein [Clostridiales bacterium]